MFIFFSSLISMFWIHKVLICGQALVKPLKAPIDNILQHLIRILHNNTIQCFWMQVEKTLFCIIMYVALTPRVYNGYYSPNWNIGNHCLSAPPPTQTRSSRRLPAWGRCRTFVCQASPPFHKELEPSSNRVAIGAYKSKACLISVKLL